jgi:hypothetical protein
MQNYSVNLISKMAIFCQIDVLIKGTIKFMISKKENRGTHLKMEEPYRELRDNILSHICV